MKSVKLRTPVLAGNWKMNIGPNHARQFMTEFLANLPPQHDRRVIMFPPAVSVAAVAESLGERTDVAVGVQNVFYLDEGAFTGEVSVPLAKDAGAEYCLVGHSERRDYFQENDDVVRRKVGAALKGKLCPIICVGESHSQRMDGKTRDVIGKQVRSATHELERDQLRQIMFAYEPIWAIGSGSSATPAQASEVHAHIRFLIGQKAGREIADGLHVLYGGSVKAETAGDLLAEPEVDGLLVGGASLDPSSWLKIVTA